MLIPNVTGDDLAAYVGRSDDVDFVLGPARQAVTLARGAASSYTRGQGFEDPDTIPAALYHVILFRAVRIIGNAQQLLTESRDGASMSYGAAAQGFTTGEIVALNEFRRLSCSI